MNRPPSRRPLIQVAVNSPLHRCFDYSLPDSFSPRDLEAIRPGIRVRVPFGRREVIGIVTGTAKHSELAPEKIRPVTAILDREPVFDADTMQLYTWASEYYHFPIGQALQTSLPVQVRQGRPLKLPAETCWQIAPTTPAEPDALAKAPQQARVFRLLRDRGSAMTAGEVSAAIGKPAHTFLNALADRELVEKRERAGADRPVVPRGQTAQPPPLNEEQQAAVDSVLARRDAYHCFLLEGITGSGKTEVYLRLIAEFLASGRQVLVLVPEISLTPQTIARFTRRFDKVVVSLHSGLNDTERFSAWLKARSGAADIIIGTRSAVFTPLARPGIIIIDEEHDASYKQQEGFRYSARNLAVYRARTLDIPVLLGSATPSLETLHHAISGRYSLLPLKERVAAATLPDYRFIDLRGLTLTEGFSRPLLDAVATHLANGNQVLVFINRRGFAPLLQCHDCGWTATCPRCETGYTLHQSAPELRCHHCDSQRRLISHCPNCQGADLQAIGTGTERSEKILAESFPGVPLLRIDRDTTRVRNALEEMIGQVKTGKPCILVGTQMLAKGHHFPGVTLAAILDADSGLFSADFRGQEHMGQLITQVAGRAGRGALSGEVLVQTHHSTHPGLNALVRDGYDTFARGLLEERREARLPPYGHQILLRAEAADRRYPLDFLEQARTFAMQSNPGETNLLGPVPAPMEKRAGRYRYQLLLEGEQRGPLHALTRKIREHFSERPESRRVRWSIDVDPLDFS